MSLKSVCCVIPVFVASVAVAEERRELDAHVHGHASLLIAIENGQIAMELEAPGMDIVGFEHAASSEADKALIDQAIHDLEDPIKLFQIPQAAGCSLSSAQIDIHGDDEGGHEDEHHEEDGHATHDEHDDHSEHAEDDDHHGHEAAGHTEFHASYVMNCSTLNDGAVWTTHFFETFPNAGELDVSLLGDGGQTGTTLTLESPDLDLAPVL